MTTQHTNARPAASSPAPPRAGRAPEPAGGCLERHHRERRRYVRRPCERWVGLMTIAPDGTRGPVRTARTEDISVGGLGLYSWEQLSGRGAVLMPRTQGGPAIVGAEVVYCRPRSRHDFDCGLRFTGPVDDLGEEDFVDEDGRPIDLGPARHDTTSRDARHGRVR